MTPGKREAFGVRVVLAPLSDGTQLSAKGGSGDRLFAGVRVDADLLIANREPREIRERSNWKLFDANCANCREWDLEFVLIREIRVKTLFAWLAYFAVHSSANGSPDRSGGLHRHRARRLGSPKSDEGGWRREKPVRADIFAVWQSPNQPSSVRSDIIGWRDGKMPLRTELGIFVGGVL